MRMREAKGIWQGQGVSSRHVARPGARIIAGRSNGSVVVGQC